ncbi:MAG: hypothetical protein IJ567_08385 [Lachnospiraceae bacterium]|nr:hypothetical protein [Lachnospiraceae bacterium]
MYEQSAGCRNRNGRSRFRRILRCACRTKRINENLFRQTSNKFILGTSVRFSIPVLSDIPVIGAIFTNIYPFEVMIVVIAVLMWFVMYRTPFGMHLRACGDNPHAADAAGINVNRVRMIAVMISGGQVLIQQLGMPSTFNDLVRILPYVLTLFLLIFFSKHNNAPRALGEIYDKGKR